MECFWGDRYPFIRTKQPHTRSKYSHDQNAELDQRTSKAASIMAASRRRTERASYGLQTRRLLPVRHGHHTFDGSPVAIRFPCATSVELRENSCRIIPKQAGIPGSDRHPTFAWGSRIPSDLLHKELGSGTRLAGGPALCYKDVWKRCKKASDINLTVRQNAATRDR